MENRKETIWVVRGGYHWDPWLNMEVEGALQYFSSEPYYSDVTQRWTTGDFWEEIEGLDLSMFVGDLKFDDGPIKVEIEVK